MGLMFLKNMDTYYNKKNYDNVWDQEYQIFFNDYIYLMSKVDEMYKYSDNSERYDAFIIYSNNIINELIIQETKDKNNKGKLLSERYEKVLSHL